MFILRTLKQDEYDLLKDTPGGTFFTPENSIVLILDDGGEIVGRISLINLIHVEAPWIREDLRNGLHLKTLAEGILKKAKEEGLKTVHAEAADFETENILQRLGWTRLPLSVWAKET